jgi:hypothetical protein
MLVRHFLIGVLITTSNRGYESHGLKQSINLSNSLSGLDRLPSVITALGGQEAVQATAEAIIDVGRWYP